jgi:hypothetical protein
MSQAGIRVMRPEAKLFLAHPQYVFLFNRHVVSSLHHFMQYEKPEDTMKKRQLSQHLWQQSSTPATDPAGLPAVQYGCCLLRYADGCWSDWPGQTKGWTLPSFRSLGFGLR